MIKPAGRKRKIKFNNVNKIKKNTHSCKADTSVVFCSNNNKTTDQYEVSSETLMFYKRSGFRCRKWLSVEDFPNRREKKNEHALKEYSAASRTNLVIRIFSFY